MHFNALVLLRVEEVHLVPPLLSWRQMVAIFIWKRKEKAIKGCVVAVFSSDGRPGNENERFSAPQKNRAHLRLTVPQGPTRLSDATRVISAFFVCVCVCLSVLSFFTFKKEIKMSICLIPTRRMRQMKIPCGFSLRLQLVIISQRLKMGGCLNTAATVGGSTREPASVGAGKRGGGLVENSSQQKEKRKTKSRGACVRLSPSCDFTHVEPGGSSSLPCRVSFLAVCCLLGNDPRILDQLSLALLSLV